MGNSKFNASEAVNCFFPTFLGLKTWFELLRVKLYRNDLRGNKIHLPEVRSVACLRLVQERNIFFLTLKGKNYVIA